MTYTQPMKTNKSVVLTSAVALFWTTNVAGAIQSQPEFISSSSGETFSDASLTSPSKCMIDPATKRWLRFQALVADWKRERGAMSSITEMSMLPSYQKIIGMGDHAIPLIVAQLEGEGDEPDQWFWALRAIANVNPVKPEDQGDMVKMAATWIEWAEKESYAG